MQKFYSVRIDKKSWTQKTVTIERLTELGFRVKPARLNGEYDVFDNEGLSKVATLFKSKKEAALYTFS